MDIEEGLKIESASGSLNSWLTEHDRSLRAVLVLGGVPLGDVDDGLQQVRLATLEAADKPSWPGVANRKAWLHAVASNVAVTWHRRRTRDRRLHERLSREWAARGEVLVPDRELAIVVARVLDELSPLHRQVLTLRFHMDLAVAEIAELLGVPEGTVKSRLHHATRAMGQFLSAEKGVV